MQATSAAIASFRPRDDSVTGFADIAGSRLYYYPRGQAFVLSSTLLDVLVLRREGSCRSTVFIAFAVEAVDYGKSCWLRNW
jgi:hypothetical protein